MRLDAEWLETDGLGGFASGPVSGVRTRRYHALLLAAMQPPTGRVVFVNGCEAWVDTPAGRLALSSQRYAPDVVHPDGLRHIERFEADPFPRWVFRLEDGTQIEQTLFVPHERPMVILTWRRLQGRGQATLCVRPLLSGRDYHALHHENSAFRFEAQSQQDDRILWRPYEGLPAISAHSNGRYSHEPCWYRNFLYSEEQARGLDCVEDLASPGVFSWDLSRGEAIWVLSAGDGGWTPSSSALPIDEWAADQWERERRRRAAFPSRLHRAADQYLVRRGEGRTLVAGYPWFTDWGRDTFIALRGMCVATGRLDEARQILAEWAGAVSEGMLPNRFPDHGEAPEFNSVDASLWYVIAVHEWMEAMAARGRRIAVRDQRLLQEAMLAIVTGYANGTRFGIRMDADGLLAAGAEGVQLTWMDAKVGDWVVTPRIGKPVEVEALWLNALWIAGRIDPAWLRTYERGRAAFRSRFWHADGSGLYDVVDDRHVPGAVDASCRPNQIFTVGGLPLALLESEQARAVVETVERRLWTPLGLRSLAAGSPGYAPRYEGGVRERDGAYHQGTVWPWLLGPFVEAWVRVRGNTHEAKREARTRFVEPLLKHLDKAGLGHISEIADAEPPHAPKGCPFQAWSVGELLRLQHVVLAEAPRQRCVTARAKAVPRAALEAVPALALMSMLGLTS